MSKRSESFPESFNSNGIVSECMSNILMKKGTQIVFQLEYRTKRIVSRRLKGCALGLPPSGKGKHVDE